MGWYLWGGWNKTHESTASAARIDSFAFRDKLLQRKQDYLEIHAHNPKIATERLYWTRVNNHYDTQGNKPRVYFICPECGRRVRFVYYKEKWGRLKCRECGKLNYPIQQVAKGTMRHAQQMRAALKKLKIVEIEKLSPMDLYDLYCVDRPRYMHRSTYQKYMRKYYKAREEYHDAYIHEAMAILGNSRDSSMIEML